MAEINNITWNKPNKIELFVCRELKGESRDKAELLRSMVKSSLEAECQFLGYKNYIIENFRVTEGTEGGVRGYRIEADVWFDSLFDPSLINMMTN
jgi:hypothetical protein